MDLIQLDDLIATLIDAVNVYSELDAIIAHFVVVIRENFLFRTCVK